jgi:RNA polymerase sigma-70 factor (ECF subfamily)
MSESEIIKRCLKKDKKAWGVFVEKYSRVVYWAIRKRAAIGSFDCDEADIDDIFQEVFLAILEGGRLSQVKNAKFIPGWLAMVAANKTIDFVRRKVRVEQNIVYNAQVFKDYTFERELFGRDIVVVIEDAINILSDKERIIISLNLLEEKTHNEIAQIIGVPINTISTVIARTKEKLKNELKKRGVGDEFL